MPTNRRLTKAEQELKDWFDAMMLEGHDLAMRNTSRYTSLGYLKRVCRNGAHVRYKDSLLCTKCGTKLEPAL